MAGPSNDGREYSAWSIVSRKSGFAHSRSVVDDKSCCVLVTHLDKVSRGLIRMEGLVSKATSEDLMFKSSTATLFIRSFSFPESV